MISRRDIYWIIAGITLSINVIIAEHFYDIGRRKVALKSTIDSLRTVEHEKAIISKQRDSIGKVLAKADSQSVKTRVVYRNSQPVIKGDSVFDDSNKFIQVVDPRISKAFVAANNYITSLESELASAKFALKVDTVFIAKDNQEINLHKSIEKLQSAPRGAWGLQVGGGYCVGSKGDNVPCVYVGVGYSVRF